MTTGTTYTLEDSASGKNAYYVACKPQAQSVAYCACLNRQKTIDAKESYPADWAACKDAARVNQCKALQMRHEERVQGIALYFKERPKLADQVLNAPDGYFTSKDVAATKRGRGKKGTLEVIASTAGSSTYADAVSAAAKEHAVISGAKPKATVLAAPIMVPTVPTVPTVTAVTMNPGESVAAYIARLRRTNTAAAAATV